MGSGAEAEVRDGAAVRNWRFARASVSTIDLLSDIHNVLVFSADFPCERIDDLPGDTTRRTACRADFEDKVGKIVERKRSGVFDRGRDRAADRTAEKSTRVLLWEKARAYDKS